MHFCDILTGEGNTKWSPASVGAAMQAMIYSGMNGIGLALVVPCVQSLIADYTLAERRGAAFGVLYFTGAIGEQQMLPGSVHWRTQCTKLGCYGEYSWQGSMVLCLWHALVNDVRERTGTYPSASPEQYTCKLRASSDSIDLQERLLPVACASFLVKAQLITIAGGLIGGFFATNLGRSTIAGIEGWRCAFHLVALVSLITSGLTLWLAVDPRRKLAVRLPLDSQAWQ